MYKGLYPTKPAILVLTFLLMFIAFHSTAISATVSWTGNGSDEYASNPNNWTDGSTSRVPAANDDVVFNATSKNCNWDIDFSIKINSFTMNTGYAGKVSLSDNLNIGTGGINISAGAFDAGQWTIELEGNWNYFNGTNNGAQTFLGDVFTPIGVVGVNDPVITIDMVDVNTILNTATGGPAYYCSDINYDGNVDILDVILALRKADDYDDPNERCAGGLFNPGTGTVKLTGVDQSISGDTVFYNLEKTGECPGETLTFVAGYQQTVLGRLTLKGEAGCELALVSDTPGSQWYIDPQGTRNISFASISDMYNRSTVKVIAISSSGEGSNNDGVSFGGSQCVCREQELLLTQLMCGEGGRGC